MSDCDDKSINNIARSFIDIYYTTLNNEKSNMKKLYCDFSKFSFTVGEDVYFIILRNLIQLQVLRIFKKHLIILMVLLKLILKMVQLMH